MKIVYFTFSSIERSRPDDVPKKALDTEKSEKPKEDDKASAPTKEAGKVPAKKEDSKPQTENESGKKGTTSDPVDANQKVSLLLSFFFI